MHPSNVTGINTTDSQPTVKYNGDLYFNVSAAG